MRTSCLLVQVERKGFYYKPKLSEENQQITDYLKETAFNNVCWGLPRMVIAVRDK